MGCQQSIADKISRKKADYVLAVKGNQGTLHEEISGFFETALEHYFKGVKHDFHKEVEADYGRIEQRKFWAIDPKMQRKSFSNLDKWKGLITIVMVKTRREMPDKITEDTRFYITSCELKAEVLLGAIRKHWSIENSLHWVLDVTFREDESRIRIGPSPENLAIIRHMALNVIKSDKTLVASVKRKRLLAALNDDFREKLVMQGIMGVKI